MIIIDLGLELAIINETIEEAKTYEFKDAITINTIKQYQKKCGEVI